jgi:hypothetical protein
MWLGTLLMERSDDIYRMKGLLSVQGMNERFVFQVILKLLLSYLLLLFSIKRHESGIETHITQAVSVLQRTYFRCYHILCSVSPIKHGFFL